MTLYIKNDCNSRRLKQQSVQNENNFQAIKHVFLYNRTCALAIIKALFYKNNIYSLETFHNAFVF